MILAKIKPRLTFVVENKLRPTEHLFEKFNIATISDAPTFDVALEFSALDDFNPYNVTRQVDPLRDLLELRERLAMLRSVIAGDTSHSVLRADAIADIGLHPQNSTQMDHGKISPVIGSSLGAINADLDSTGIGKLAREFFSGVHFNDICTRNSVGLYITSILAAIDRAISIQLDQILHHFAFQALEATWRGFWYLLSQTEVSSLLRINILDISKLQILEDLRLASESSDTKLFRLLNEPLQTIGAAPYGCIVTDFKFGPSPEDMHMLQHLACVAESIHAPFIGTASPELVNPVPTGFWSEVDLREPSIHCPEARATWESFRRTEQARYVTLVLPFIRLRASYGRNGLSSGGFSYVEDDSHPLWGSAAWPLAANLSSAFSKYNWCAAIQGRDSGGLVSGLPASLAAFDENMLGNLVTDIVVTERLENIFFTLGFCSLCLDRQDVGAVFQRVATCRIPGGFSEMRANRNDIFASELRYVLACCRFAIGMRMLVRDDPPDSIQNCERLVNHWLLQYVTLDDLATMSTKSQYPLREARATLYEEHPDDTWIAALFLRPHFQLPNLSDSMRLISVIRTNKKHAQ